MPLNPQYSVWILWTVVAFVLRVLAGVLTCASVTLAGSRNGKINVSRL